jgi:hypothetical protein
MTSRNFLQGSCSYCSCSSKTATASQSLELSIRNDNRLHVNTHLLDELSRGLLVTPRCARHETTCCWLQGKKKRGTKNDDFFKKRGQHCNGGEKMATIPTSCSYVILILLQALYLQDRAILFFHGAHDIRSFKAVVWTDQSNDECPWLACV